MLYRDRYWSYIAGRKLKDGWPSQGAIVFDEVFLTYSKNEPSVLKNITFAVKPAEKVTSLISMMWLLIRENFKKF